jgi:LysM repeat protein
MNVPAFLVPVCLSLFVFGIGCSGEDQPLEPAASPKVVQAIKQPLPEKEKAPAVSGEKGAEQAPEEKPAQPADKAAVKPIDEVVERPSTALATQDPVAEKAPAPVKASQESRDKPGYYVVKKGDTLSKIAARRDTMRDPLKWPILIRLNVDKLAGLPAGADIATRELPPGIELRYITPGEAKEGLTKPSGSTWVVNVLSAPTEAEIVPPAVILSKQGFPAYITRAQVKGKDYLRLRVGFFESKKEASKQGEKIKKLLNFQDFWATNVDDVEYEEVAGFLKNP